MTVKLSSSYLLIGILTLAGCASNTKPSATAFGAAVTSTRDAEAAYLAAINMKQKDFSDIHVLGAKRVVLRTDGKVQVDTDSQPPPDRTIPADATVAINSLLTPIAAYGAALQSLSSDTAATTFKTNADNIAKQAMALNSSVLEPLKLSAFPSDAEVNAVTSAVKDLGGIVIDALISKDVKRAAEKARQPLQVLVTGLKTVNHYWATNVPQNLSSETAGAAVALWNDPTRPPSFDERLALKATWEKAFLQVNSSDADHALDALVMANDKVATAGPASAKAEIESLAQAAADATNVYNAFKK